MRDADAEPEGAHGVDVGDFLGEGVEDEAQAGVVAGVEVLEVA